ATGGRAIAARPSSFLIVRLRRSRNGPMGNEANRRLVDAHTECAGRHDDAHLVTEKPLENAAALGCGHAGVIWCGGGAIFDQSPRDTFDQAAGWCVHDRGTACSANQGAEASEPLIATGNPHYLEPKVRSVERTDDLPRVVAERQRALDFPANLRRGGAGECDARRIAEHRARTMQRAVARPEVVAPFHDAVRFIDGEPAYAPAAGKQFVGE